MLPAAAAICLALSPAAAEAGDLPPLRASRPRLPASTTSAAGFAPHGWRLEHAVRGDLNGDKRPDLVAILHARDPRCLVRREGSSEAMDSNPRILLVAFGGAHGFTLQSANAKVIPRIDDPYMDDPFGGLTLRGDVIRLGLTYWRSMGGWTTYSSTLSFRWQGGRFRLIGFDRETLQRNSGTTEDLSMNFITGRAKIVTGSMEDDVDSKTRWRPIRPRGPETLETMGDGLAFDPQLPGLD